MDAKNILGIVPGLQATALVGHNLKMFDMKPKKHNGKKLIKIGITNLTAIPLISATAGEINKL